MKKVLAAMILQVMVLSPAQLATGQPVHESLNEHLFGTAYRGDNK